MNLNVLLDFPGISLNSIRRITLKENKNNAILEEVQKYEQTFVKADECDLYGCLLSGVKECETCKETTILPPYITALGYNPEEAFNLAIERLKSCWLEYTSKVSLRKYK